jgi:hypothetical protein
LYKVRIYIWYQSFIGFRGTPLSSRVWLGTVISLVTVGDLWYFFLGEKKWQAIRRWRSRSLMGKRFELWKLKMEDLLVDRDQWIAVDLGTTPTGTSADD